MDISLINLSPAQLAAKCINQTNRSIFLTGKAGTGKTTFLRSVIDSGFGLLDSADQLIFSGCFLRIFSAFAAEFKARFGQ